MHVCQCSVRLSNIDLSFLSFFIFCPLECLSMLFCNAIKYWYGFFYVSSFSVFCLLLHDWLEQMFMLWWWSSLKTRPLKSYLLHDHDIDSPFGRLTCSSLPLTGWWYPGCHNLYTGASYVVRGAFLSCCHSQTCQSLGSYILQKLNSLHARSMLNKHVRL